MIEAIVAAILAAMASVSVPAEPDPLEGALVYHSRVEAAVKAGRDAEREIAAVKAAKAAKRAAAQKAEPSQNGPSPEAWAALRACESGGDYTVVSSNGLWFGAYQFTRGTWASYGSPGNPALASPAEQDRRARALYAARGSQPWPVCGRYLEE